MWCNKKEKKRLKEREQEEGGRGGKSDMYTTTVCVSG